MKKLFVITTDNGDGSYSSNYTMDEGHIKAIQEAYDNGEIGYEEGIGDGDGFHYDTLTVPDECTLESLGITYAFEVEL